MKIYSTKNNLNLDYQDHHNWILRENDSKVLWCKNGLESDPNYQGQDIITESVSECLQSYSTCFSMSKFQADLESFAQELKETHKI